MSNYISSLIILQFNKIQIQRKLHHLKIRQMYTPRLLGGKDDIYTMEGYECAVSPGIGRPVLKPHSLHTIYTASILFS